ncbi:MAG: leucine-rich repeat domain-containing protein [Bacteroidales bacterium]|nr:leucine-rich repeat domain-containing protein [Bacteroidales bacterium]
MKKSLLILFVIILAINFGTQAADFSAVYNGKTIYYNITSSTSPLRVAVTYRGNSYDSYPNEYSGLIIIPDSVQYNGNYYKITSFGINAFASCILLTSIIIPNSVTSIDFNAFDNCSGLTSITIPNSITSISGGAFEDCSGLTSVTIPNSVTSIGNYAFAGCSGLTSVIIPNSITAISNGAFEDCSGLTSVTIPNSVTSIGYSAFSYCFGLTSITIPNSVTSIGSSAFEDCTGLTSITIPSSVTSIGNYAFYNCSGLTSITSKAINPPDVQLNAFSGVSRDIPVYVPCPSLSLYQSAENWSDFNLIQCNSLDNITNTEFKIKLYPNPTIDRTQLEIEGLTTNADVFVYDMIGRVVKTHKINQGTKELEIDLSGYIKGVYSIRILNESINQTKKLIVQ